MPTSMLVLYALPHHIITITLGSDPLLSTVPMAESEPKARGIGPKDCRNSSILLRAAAMHRNRQISKESQEEWMNRKGLSFALVLN